MDLIERKLARIVVSKAVAALQPGWQKIEAGNADEAEALLDAGGVDLAIINTTEPSHGTVSQVLGRERLVLVGPAKAGLSMRKDTTIRALADLPLILTMRPNSLRLMVEDRLGLHGLTADVRLEVNTLPLMTNLVTAGLGYTVLPLCGVRDALKQKQVSASPIADMFVTWLVARPKSRALGVAAERFHDMLCDFSRKLIAKGAWQEA